MDFKKRPYLIVPKLIDQPTWGGDYIVNLKNWKKLDLLQGKKIGQSYELFSQTKLLLDINNTDDERFIPELGEADSDTIFNQTRYEKNKDYLHLDQVTNLVEKILLIKMTQARGNSFQLHVKDSVKDERWVAKPESWYFFEDGLVTLGIKKNISLEDYKKCCLAIDEKMHSLSTQIKEKIISLEEAKKQAEIFIKSLNPWQYVNLIEVKKNSVVDPSIGGMHHSWEEDDLRFPNGNVLFEVQKDAMDPIATIRCFDKGKFKNDGSIRDLHINDYFKYLNTDENDNDVNHLVKKANEENLIKTNNYCFDLIEVDNKKQTNSQTTYIHLFVKEGKIKVAVNDCEVTVGAGFSCFIPEGIDVIDIINLDSKKSLVLKTYLPS